MAVCPKYPAIRSLLVTLLNTPFFKIPKFANIEPIILGSVLALAVVFDIFTRNVRPIDLVGVHYAKKELGEEFKAAKHGFKAAKDALKEARKLNKEDLIEYEYQFTNAQGAFNRIKDRIRAAQEEDFLPAKN